MTDRSSASPKPATGETKAANSKLLQELPFADMQDFEDAKSGFIAPLPNNGVVTNAKGEPIYDLSKFTAFIGEGKAAPDTAGDPVNNTLSEITGCPAFAGHDHREWDDPRRIIPP
ncbi:MAG: hypothetical protein WAL02_14280 [Rhodoplanes sp.]